MPKNTVPLRSIALMCAYLDEDEHSHWEECGKPKDHIWREVNRVKAWCKKVQRNSRKN